MRTILFTDSGDTIIDEGTEVRLVPGGVVQTAECIPGAKEALLEVRGRGHTIALVADGLDESFRRMFTQHGIMGCFDAWAVSELVGAEKPDGRMFRAAFDSLGLTEADKARVVMIGNNVQRDIAGANRFGIRSILLRWSHRYRMEPLGEEETPTYAIDSPSELPGLIERIERELER